MLMADFVKREVTMEQWIVQEREQVFKSRVFELIKKRCRHPLTEVEYNFFTIETQNWINLVARTDDGRYVLVKQHRLGNDAVTLETPGGLIDDGETPEACARRELMEETGYSCENMVFIKKLAVNPAILNNYIYIFLATGCKKAGDQRLDEAEDIEIVTLDEKELWEAVDRGAIDHSIVVMALLLCAQASLLGR